MSVRNQSGRNLVTRWRVNTWPLLIRRKPQCFHRHWSMMADNQLRQKEVTAVARRCMGNKVVMKTILRWGSLSLLVLPLAIVQVANLTHQEKTFDTTSAPHIGLSNFMGHVVVKGWDRPQVHAVYETGSPQTLIDIDQLPSGGRRKKFISPRAFRVRRRVSRIRLFFTLWKCRWGRVSKFEIPRVEWTSKGCKA